MYIDLVGGAHAEAFAQVMHVVVGNNASLTPLWEVGLGAFLCYRGNHLQHVNTFLNMDSTERVLSKAMSYTHINNRYARVDTHTDTVCQNMNTERHTRTQTK